MKLSVHGWGRNMGTDELADLDLKDLEISDDANGTVWRDRPRMFKRRHENIFVAWCQKLRHMGDYYVKLQFSGDDILQLYKSKFGTELTCWELDHGGFTVSPDLVKRILSTVKLTDVTLGQLMEMSSASEDAATADKLIERSPNVRRLTPRT
jgi:hypothetical protein